MSDLPQFLPSGSRSYVVNNFAHLRHSRFAQHVNMVPYNPERGRRPVTESNVEDRFELFLLGEGEKKVTEAIDTRKLSSFLILPGSSVQLIKVCESTSQSA